MINVQRSFGRSWMAEAGYLRTDGWNFPLSRPLASAFDRQTGARPNPALGTPSGVYLTSEQTMVYDALQASVRRRFEDDLGLGLHYTYSLSLIHISEPTRLLSISYAVFCLK